MSAPIPEDLRELYAAAMSVKETMPGLWIPHAGPRVVELIERIAALEEENRLLAMANRVMRIRRAALASTEPGP